MNKNDGFCPMCGNELRECYPREIVENEYCCGDCAFIGGFITEDEYLKRHLYSIALDGLRAAVKDGAIHITTSKFPWERTSRDRECKAYSEWRTAVYTRDNFTCVSCGQVGGELNAHHIKEYAKYPQMRYDVKNGVTLCVKCHKQVHRKSG